jgi:hypothetical protein
MSRPWVNNEDGPDCFCGGPTVVKILPDGAFLLCLFHERAEGKLYQLPNEAPDEFPNLPIQDLAS